MSANHSNLEQHASSRWGGARVLSAAAWWVPTRLARCEAAALVEARAATEAKQPPQCPTHQPASNFSFEKIPRGLPVTTGIRPRRDSSRKMQRSRMSNVHLRQVVGTSKCGAEDRPTVARFWGDTGGGGSDLPSAKSAVPDPSLIPTRAGVVNSFPWQDTP
jgi:hypothetical protein